MAALAAVVASDPPNAYAAAERAPAPDTRCSSCQHWKSIAYSPITVLHMAA